MIYYIDIDETICHSSPPERYDLAEPMQEVIDEVNRLYSEGHTIVFWTARGALTGIDWRGITYTQLKTWKVNYHTLRFDKPAFDIFIDDKNINSNDWHTSIKKN